MGIPSLPGPHHPLPTSPLAFIPAATLWNSLGFLLFSQLLVEGAQPPLELSTQLSFLLF